MINITITGVKLTPTWDTLEQALREATRDEKATIVRISKVDNYEMNCDYRSPDLYELGLRTSNNDITKVNLHVTE